MSFIYNHFRGQRDAQADRADTAEARALELEAALDDLTRAIGTCKMSTHVDAGMMNRARAHGSMVVRAPHVQDPRVQSALTEARRTLGRAL